MALYWNNVQYPPEISQRTSNYQTKLNWRSTSFSYLPPLEPASGLPIWNAHSLPRYSILLLSSPLLSLRVCVHVWSTRGAFLSNMNLLVSPWGRSGSVTLSFSFWNQYFPFIQFVGLSGWWLWINYTWCFSYLVLGVLSLVASISNNYVSLVCGVPR